ncbi:MAG: NAD-dependent epimerase/dehydratase family protein [Candidatus Tectimicrobiota bacterium]
MHTLVIGGAGFIGSHTVDVLLARGHTVRVLDALVPQVHGMTPQRPAYLDPRAELLVGRVEDADMVAQALDGVESVIHLAAAVGVGQSMYQVTQYCTTNTMGTAALLQTLIDCKTRLHSLVVASSMSVYGEGLYCTPDGHAVSPHVRSEAQMAAGDWDMHAPDHLPLAPIPTHEDKPLQPTSIYAINKRDQEEMCLCVGSAYGIPTTALRFFNVYGSRQALSNPYTGVAAIFCARLLNERPPLIFEDGKQQRDFVHVADVARAVVAAAEQPVMGEAINIGSGAPLSVREIAELLALELHRDIAPQIVGKYRRGDIRHCFADISKARQLLHWQPQYAFRQGVSELVAWVQAQREARDSVNSAWDELQKQGLLV